MYECPECQSIHDEPADARLGHVIPCLGCAVGFDDGSSARELLPAA